MHIDYKPINLDIKNKSRNLSSSASGVVKSTKYFPVFLIDNKEYIFKPISKTKPYNTPLYAFSEVFWSNIINEYFYPTVKYKLAYCNGLNKEQAKYNDYGTLVESVIKKNQKLINLLEYFNKYPEDFVDIKDYENYCMEIYDYTKILNSNFIKNNKNIGEKLAYYILLSMLRQDQNFHYENIMFIEENNKIIDIAPPLDFEFSQFFMFPLNEEKSYYYSYYEAYLSHISIIPRDIDSNAALKPTYFLEQEPILKRRFNCLNNLSQIVKLYPNIINLFIKNLEIFIKDIDNIEINDNYNFITPCNSQIFTVNKWKLEGIPNVIKRINNFHSSDEESKQSIIKDMFWIVENTKLKNIDKNYIFERIKTNLKKHSENLLYTIKTYKYLNELGIDNLEDIVSKKDILELSSHNEYLNKEKLRILKLYNAVPNIKKIDLPQLKPLE